MKLHNKTRQNYKVKVRVVSLIATDSTSVVYVNVHQTDIQHDKVLILYLISGSDSINIQLLEKKYIVCNFNKTVPQHIITIEYSTAYTNTLPFLFLLYCLHHVTP